VHLAGLFAAKEAVIKAVSPSTIFFEDIEVFHTSQGAPYVLVKGKVISMLISISHSNSVAVAVAVR